MTAVVERRRASAKVMLSRRAENMLHRATVPQFGMPVRRRSGLVISDEGYDYVLDHGRESDDGVVVLDVHGHPAETGESMSGMVPGFGGVGEVERSIFREGVFGTEGLHSVVMLYDDNSLMPLTNLFGPVSSSGYPVQFDEWDSLTASVTIPGIPEEQDWSFSVPVFLQGILHLQESTQEMPFAAASSDPISVPDVDWPREMGPLEAPAERHPVLLERKRLLSQTSASGEQQGSGGGLEVPLGALDIGLQLNELRNLKEGWAEGLQPAGAWGNSFGYSPSDAGLDWLVRQFDRFYAASLLRPYLFPTPLGGVQAEWLVEPHDASLEIDLESHSAEWHCLNLDTKASVVRDLDLDDGESWAWLSVQISSLGPAVE